MDFITFFTSILSDEQCRIHCSLIDALLQHRQGPIDIDAEYDLQVHHRQSSHSVLKSFSVSLSMSIGWARSQLL